MTHPTDDTFEAALSAILRETRPFSGAPPGLLERVSRIPMLLPRAPRAAVAADWLTYATRAAAVIALVGAVGAVAALAGLATLAPDVGSPTAPPSTAVFDPTVDGPGIISAKGATLTWVPQLIALAFGAGLVLLGLRRSRMLGLVGVVGALIAFNGAHFVSNQRGLQFASTWGPGTGIRVERAPAATNGPDAFYIVAQPGEIFWVKFNVINDGTLPVRFLGVIGEEAIGQTWQPRWTAVGVDPDQSGGFAGIDQAQPFEPIELQPNEHLNLFLVGRAGACASGPNVVEFGEGDYFHGPAIRMAFSVFGMTASSEVEPPFALAQLDAEGCDAFPTEL